MDGERSHCCPMLTPLSQPMFPSARGWIRASTPWSKKAPALLPKVAWWVHPQCGLRSWWRRNLWG